MEDVGFVRRSNSGQNISSHLSVIWLTLFLRAFVQRNYFSNLIEHTGTKLNVYNREPKLQGSQNYALFFGYVRLTKDKI